jgi:hypothetical protein
MVLEITRRPSAPLSPPFDRCLQSHTYSWFRDRTKVQEILRWNRNVQRENQRSAKGRGTARRPRALGARRVEEKFQRNIARSLPLHWTPQETDRMLLKMQNDVNASLCVLRLCASLRDLSSLFRNVPFPCVSTRLSGTTPLRISGASAEISGYRSTMYRVQQPACARSKLW